MTSLEEQKTPLRCNREYMTNTLLVEFDDLFDTERFYDVLPDEPEAFRDAYDQTIRGDYSRESYADPDYSLEALANDLRSQGVDVTDDEIRNAFDRAPDFLYEPETLEYLTEEYDVDEVVVASRASRPAWQRRKMRESGIDSFADEVIVVYDPDMGEDVIAGSPEQPGTWNAQIVNEDMTSIGEDTVESFLRTNNTTLDDVVAYLEG